MLYGWVRWFSFVVVRGLISLRYRLEVEGIEKVSMRGGGPGILFLPNHPAELDPIMLMLALQKFRPRPLVTERFYYLKGWHFFMKLVNAMPLPDLNGSANRWKMKRVEKALEDITDRLKAGDNFLIYPAGRLKLGEEECLGGASFIFNLLQASPGVRVVLIKTRGMWGSLFSRAPTQNVPDFGKVILEGAKILLKNGIFFAPRRTVTIRVEPAQEELDKMGSKRELNAYLEEWYNTPPDKLIKVPFYFWKREVVSIAPVKKECKEKRVALSKQVEEAVCTKVGELAKLSVDRVSREMSLSQDLGLDSLDMAELFAFLDENYGVSSLEPGSINTVYDLMLAAAGEKRGASPEEESAPCKRVAEWEDKAGRPKPFSPEGSTLQEAFLIACDRMGSHVACGDALLGVFSYRRFKLAALLLSFKIAHMPGEQIGIMLPASTSAYLLIIATLLAGKVPVMLNWTVGKRSLNHALELTQIETVLSSQRFLNHLDHVELGHMEDKLFFLEDLKRAVTLFEKGRAWIWNHFSAKRLLKKLQLEACSGEDRAVILFTSGTETLPKAVPLTHTNLLSNQRSALSCIDLGEEDILYGFLPPFHSFGFSVTGLLPLLSGLKVYFSPDPTDAKTLAREISLWKPTFLCAAPSFIKGIFRAATAGELSSLRLIVSGAEKTPRELFEKVSALGPQAKLLEGYGITECSPIVTVDRLDKPHRGVGEPLPGVSLMVIHPETKAPLEPGEEGEICIAGPNIFAGYLHLAKDPFIVWEGKQWYRSGDRGFIAPDGALHLSGRLKRFVKIGGEMVSLSGLEDELMQILQESHQRLSSLEGPSLAVVGKGREEEDKVELVLFTPLDLDKHDLNALLREKGGSRLAKISEVCKIEQIPLMGTGKIDYRLLEELCKQTPYS